MNLPQITERIQSIVGAERDGDWGPETAQKVLTKLLECDTTVHVPITQLPVVDTVGPRSEAIFARLQPEVVPYMRALTHLAAKHGINIVATSGLRTYAEQDALYEQGRSKPGKIVTNARGGYSSHNFGTAVDFTVFNSRMPVWESPKYATLGGLAKSIGLSWGGDWSSPDEPHFYLKPTWAKDMSESKMMAELRKRIATKQKIYA